MKFKFENLPKIVQYEVFKYVDADELLEFRFLNKHIFNIIHPIIYEYLCYSIYDNFNDPFNEVQHDFIKNNASKVKYLNTITLDKEIPGYLRIKEDIKALADIEGNSYLNNDICDEYTNLKSIDIHIDYYEEDQELELVLNYYRKLLFKVEELSIDTSYTADLDLILSLLNPNKLRVLIIDHIGGGLDITLSDISKFSQFKYLECLEIYADDFEIKSNHQSDSNTEIFPSLKILKLYGCCGFDFEMLSNISNLESFHLCQYEDNLENLDYLREKPISKIYLECCIDNSPYSNSSSGIDHLKFIPTITNKTCLSLRGSRLTRDEGKFINLPLFLNVDEITFSYCHLNINYIFNMLDYFPNIKKVIFKNGKLFTYSNNPLRLPNNLESFLFCIEMKYTKFYNKGIILSLLDTVPTYIY